MKHAKVITEGFEGHAHFFNRGDDIVQIEERDEDGHIRFLRLSDGHTQYLDDTDFEYLEEEAT